MKQNSKTALRNGLLVAGVLTGAALFAPAALAWDDKGCTTCGGKTVIPKVDIVIPTIKTHTHIAVPTVSYGSSTTYKRGGCGSCGGGDDHHHGGKKKVKIDIDIDKSKKVWNIDKSKKIVKIDKSVHIDKSKKIIDKSKTVNKVKIVNKNEIDNSVTNNVTNNVFTESFSEATAAVRLDLGGFQAFGGGGGSYIPPSPIVAPIGALEVHIREPQESRPVKAVCLDAKGLQDAAGFSTGEREFFGDAEAEVFHCMDGHTLVATVGRMVESDEGLKPDYTGGFEIECADGEALRLGEGGLLACAPRSADPGMTRWNATEGGFSEVIIHRHSRVGRTASVGTGGGFYSGGVGY